MQNHSASYNAASQPATNPLATLAFVVGNGLVGYLSGALSIGVTFAMVQASQTPADYALTFGTMLVGVLPVIASVCATIKKFPGSELRDMGSALAGFTAIFAGGIIMASTMSDDTATQIAKVVDPAVSHCNVVPYSTINCHRLG